MTSRVHSRLAEQHAALGAMGERVAALEGPQPPALEGPQPPAPPRPQSPQPQQQRQQSPQPPAAERFSSPPPSSRDYGNPRAASPLAEQQDHRHKQHDHQHQHHQPPPPAGTSLLSSLNFSLSAAEGKLLLRIPAVLSFLKQSPAVHPAVSPSSVKLNAFESR